MYRKCVYAGTFDPPTVGHEAVVRRTLAVFDEVVVAVMVNGSKTPLFSVEDRLRLVGKLFSGVPGVRVISYGGTVGDLLVEEDTPFYVRGIRDAADLSYEMRDFYATKDLYPGAEEIFLPATRDVMHVSSTLVKNCISFGKDFSAYVPGKIYGDVARLSGGAHVPEGD